MMCIVVHLKKEVKRRLKKSPFEFLIPPYDTLTYNICPPHNTQSSTIAKLPLIALIHYTWSKEQAVARSPTNQTEWDRLVNHHHHPLTFAV